MERFNLSDHLFQVYELDLYEQEGLRCNSDPIESYPTDIPEDFKSMVKIISTSDDEVTWRLELDEYEGMFGSLTSGSKKIKQGEKYKHRHEFVCESIQMGKSDAKISTISKLGDDDDDRTPDFILINDDVIHVIELTTSRFDRTDLIYRAYRNKEFAYSSALLNRVDHRIITYTIIVITPNRVLSTIQLPDMLVTEMVARMRIALCLDSRAEEINLDLEDDERAIFRIKIAKNIEKEITSMNLTLKNMHSLSIDEDYLASCLTPSNENKLMEVFVSEMIKTGDEVRNIPEFGYKKDVENFKNSFSEGNRRYDKKPVTFFPWINTRETTPSSDVPKIPINECDDLPVVSKLWSSAMDYYELSPYTEEEDPGSLLDEALEEDLGKIKQIEDDRKNKRRHYHRVDLKKVVTDEDLIVLSKQGLWAKKHRNDDYMKARRIHQQSAFTWGTDVDDIERYFKDTYGLEEANTEKDEKIELLRHANQIAGNSKKPIEILEQWRRTNLYQSLDIISDISYEIAISNKQHCKSKEMILKKLRHYEIYLLISPTNSSEHTFFSIYIPKPCRIKYDGVFGRMYNCIGGMMSDFNSIKVGKLENQSSMPASLISLASFWAWFYDLPDASPSSFQKSSEAYYMLKFSLLVRLEDKSQTEETITQTRYMYMEIFKSFFSVTFPNPFKVLSKLSSYPRSRLNLFCMKKIILNFELMLEVEPTRTLNTSKQPVEEGEDSVPNDYWNNLLNWISGGPVFTASKAINLVYLGYLKNKMESAEGNTDFQLVDKTCEEEFKIDWNDVSKYRGECESNPKPKQFSKNAIKHGSDVLISRLKNILGDEWQTIIHKEILETLSSKMTLEIATLKASANIDHNSTDECAKLSSTKSAGRMKVIESVVKHLDEMSLNPLTKISQMISKIEDSSKGVVCDLFKKQQHGGLREIYVLTIESRIVQLYIETISRVICSYFEEETLTHPKNKLRKLDEHRSNSARIANRENCVYADFCSSTDKTRWNQNLMMTALVIPLVRILPECYHPSIVRTLNLWSNKLIKLPQRVVNLLINSVEMKSATFHKLLEEFWNPSENSIFTRYTSNFIRLTSGMMQGILHYTSSLLHLTFLNSMNKIIPKMMKQSYKSHSFMITQVCSSDDSATILTVFSPSNKRLLDSETYHICKKTSQVLETLNNMAPYYCMTNSVKSTTGLIDYVEFNSEFLFRNTIAIPIIKYVSASLNLTEAESFLERFHTQYNLISDLFSSGFPAQNTYLCQLAQGLNHYKTMGGNVNPLFNEWSKSIKRIPDPILGYFLVDTEFCPGVLGFSYTYWKCFLSSTILRRSMKSMLSDATEVTDSGGIVQSLILKYGEVSRWRKLVETVSKDIDFREMIQLDPEILFREPRSMKDLKVSLAIKSTMPSVSKSMRRGNPYLQALSMSVYAINTQCFSKSTVTQDLSGKLVREIGKTSLLREIQKRAREHEEEPSIINDEVIEITFPAVERYKEAQKIIDELKKFELMECSKFRHRRTEVYVQPFSTFVPLSLLQVSQSLWFGYKTRTSMSILKRCINAYKTKIPWLKDTIIETLEYSPFNTYQELSNFISSHAIKSRTFVRIGPGVYSKRFTGQLYHLIRKSQKDGFVLRAKVEEGRRGLKEYRGTAEIISKLSLALTLPTPKSREDQVKRILTTSPKLYDDISSIQRMSKRDANLAYIQGYLKGQFTMEEICTSIQQTGNGMLFAYTTMQQKVETAKGVEWKGHGECYVMCEKSLVVVKMHDDKAEKIEISNWRSMRSHPTTMTSILAELKLKPSMKQQQKRAYYGKIVSRFDGHHWLPPQANGIPVYETKLVSRVRDVEDVKLEISFQSINLTQYTHKGRTSMIRFKTYPGDVMLNAHLIPGNDISDCWINQRSIEADWGLGMIISSQKPDTTEKVKFWIIETLTARLSQKGLMKGPGERPTWLPSIEVSQQIHEVEISDEFLEKLDVEMVLTDKDAFGLEYEYILKELPKPEEEETYEYEEPHKEEETTLSGWAFVMHNWTTMEIEENVDITSKGVKSFKYLHPFWDKVIDSLDLQYKGFWEQVYSGYEVEQLDIISKALMALLGLKKRDRPFGLQEQALSRVEQATIQLESIPEEKTISLETEPIASTSSYVPPVSDVDPSWKSEASDDDDDDWFDKYYQC